MNTSPSIWGVGVLSSNGTCIHGVRLPDILTINNDTGTGFGYYTIDINNDHDLSPPTNTDGFALVLMHSNIYIRDAVAFGNDGNDIVIQPTANVTHASSCLDLTYDARYFDKMFHDIKGILPNSQVAETKFDKHGKTSVSRIGCGPIDDWEYEFGYQIDPFLWEETRKDATKNQQNVGQSIDLISWDDYDDGNFECDVSSYSTTSRSSRSSGSSSSSKKSKSKSKSQDEEEEEEMEEEENEQRFLLTTSRTTANVRGGRGIRSTHRRRDLVEFD